MGFQARYEGKCVECGERIHIGDQIEIAEQSVADGFGQTTYVHVDCDDAYEETELDRDAKREVCPVCFLLKPCGCEVA